MHQQNRTCYAYVWQLLMLSNPPINIRQTRSSHTFIKTTHLSEKKCCCFLYAGETWAEDKELQIADPECIESLRCDSESNITTSHLQMHLWRTAAFLYADKNV